MDVIGSFTCHIYKGQVSSFEYGAQDLGCNTDNLLSPSAYQCGYRCWTTNAYFYFTFKGVKFQIYGTMDPNNKKFDVEIDGTIVKEVDEYSENRYVYHLIYTSDLLEYKEHRVKIIAKGENYELYKISYWPSLRARRLNSTDFLKDGLWQKESDGIGGAREKVNGSFIATIDIRCTKFWLYGIKDADLGNVDITFAGVTEQINQYSNYRIESCLIYESTGLPFITENLAITSSGSNFVLYCLYYEVFEVQTETPYPTHTIDPLKPTPEATPIPTPIPISVGLSQMNPSGTIICDGEKDIYEDDIQSLGCEQNVLDHPNAYHCGFRCWTNEGNYSYTFYGVIHHMEYFMLVLIMVKIFQSMKMALEKNTSLYMSQIS